MTRSAWILFLPVDAGNDAAQALPELTARLAAAHPEVSVHGAVLGGRDGVATVLRRLHRAGYQEAVIVPLWFGLPDGITADLDRQLLNSHLLRPEMRVLLADPLPVSGIVPDELNEGVAGAKPLFGLQAGRARPPSIRQKRRRRTPPAAYERMALVCTGYGCMGRGGLQLSHLLTRVVQEHGGSAVRVARTNCLGPCTSGPVAHIVPDGTWYGGLGEDEIRRIGLEHLVGGAVCADLELRKEEAL